MASHIYTMTPEACGTFDGDSPAVYLWHYDEPVLNGDAYQHGPISPAQARQLAIDLLEAAREAEELAETVQA